MAKTMSNKRIQKSVETTISMSNSEQIQLLINLNIQNTLAIDITYKCINFIENDCENAAEIPKVATACIKETIPKIQSK